MAKGDGSISAVKDKSGNVVLNRWRVGLSFGVIPLTGKPNRITKIVNGSKVDARRAAKAIRRRAGIQPEPHHVQQDVETLDIVPLYRRSRK